MKCFLTFHSTVLDPADTLGTCGQVHAMLLFDALARKFRMNRNPRMFFPVTQWGFHFTAARVQMFLRIGRVTHEPTDVWQIELFAGGIIERLLWPKKLSAAVDIVARAITEWVTSDTRFSELRRHGERQVT